MTNLQDDHNASVNLQKVIEAYWKEANRKNDYKFDQFNESFFDFIKESEEKIYKKFIITEMSLSGNMPLSEMVDRKIKWKTLEEEKIETSNLTDFKSVIVNPL